MRVLYLLIAEPAVSETFVTNEQRAVAVRAGDGSVLSLSVLGLPWLRLVGGWSPVSFIRAMGCMRGDLLYRVRNALLVSLAFRRARALRPDLIHTHFLTAPFLVAAEVARQLGVPVTVLAHAADYRAGRAKTESARVLRAVHQRSQGALLLISEAARREMLSLGYPTVVVNSARVVRPAVALELPERDASSEVTIVTVARLVPKKGVDRVIHAVAGLVREGREVTYVIVGAGPERSNLEQVAAALGIGDRVKFLGSKSHENALDLIAKATLCVLLCRVADDGDVDGIPVFLLEAVALGVPVVATAVSGVPDITDGTDVPLLDAHAPSEVVTQRLRHLIDAPEAADSDADTLRRRFHDEFAPDVQAARLWRVWGELSDVSRGRTSG